MKKFGLNTLDDLPDLPNYKIDENRQIVIEDILENKEEKDNQEEEDKKEEAEENIEGEIQKTDETGEDEEAWKMI